MASSGRAATSCRASGRTSAPGPAKDRPGTRSRRRSSPATSGPPWPSISSNGPARIATHRRPRGSHPDRVGGTARRARPRLEPALGGRRRPGRGPHRRRQRHRQDDDHRQARQPLQGRGSLGAARRRRHVPGRGHRPVADLGRPGQGPDGRPRARARTRVRSSTTRSTRPWPVAPTSSSPTRRAGSTPARTSWTSCRRSGGSSTSACPAPSPRRSSCSMRRPARTVSPRRRRSTRRSG